MAIEKLPVDYVQDVIDTTVTDKRRYKMITNTDGTMSLDDVTTYVLEGTEFGADDINQTNRTVNDVIDEIEGIENGTITVGKASCADSAGSAESVSNDFILIKQSEIAFTDNVCILLDERITEDSLADVYFTADTMSAAQKASIDVDTYDGYLTLTAGRTPEGVLKASIHVRVV